MIKTYLKNGWWIVLLAGELLLNACSPDEPQRSYPPRLDTIPEQQDDDYPSDDSSDNEFGPV